MKPVCLVIGAGAGIGGHVGKRFASGGYHTVFCRRSDKEGLDLLVEQVKAAGGTASGVLLNAVEENTLETLIMETERETGPIEVLLFNLGAQIGNRNLADTSYKAFELGWRMACFALFRVAKTIMPYMAARGGGTLLITSATAALRGNAGQHSHASAIGGRRLLAQSLNAEFAPKGIHIAHIVIDGPVDAPDTLGKLLGPEAFARLRKEKGEGKDALLNPEKLSETYWHLAHQHRSAWTHEIDLRPWTDTPWWNDN